MAFEVTRLLNEAGAGDADAARDLFPLIYDELRGLAAQRMREERDGHTLQPTALVHEAFLRLTKGQTEAFEDRRHFYLAAAQAMRRILIEHARARGRDKRGGDRQRIELDDRLPDGQSTPEDIVVLNDALRKLEAIDEVMGEVVALRYFAGFSVNETADVLGISGRTVNRHWTAARAWLFQAMHDNRDAAAE